MEKQTEKAILASLAKVPGSTVEEIAVALGEEPAVVQREIGSLEEDGYVRGLEGIGKKGGTGSAIAERGSSHFVVTSRGRSALRR